MSYEGRKCPGQRMMAAFGILGSLMAGILIVGPRLPSYLASRTPELRDDIPLVYDVQIVNTPSEQGVAYRIEESTAERYGFTVPEPASTLLVDIGFDGTLDRAGFVFPPKDGEESGTQIDYFALDSDNYQRAEGVHDIIKAQARGEYITGEELSKKKED